MVPNELRELNVSIGCIGRIIEVKGCRISDWQTLIALTSLELIRLTDFCKENDNRVIIMRNGKRKLTINFHPKFFQFCLNLHTHSGVKFISKQVTLFCAEYTTIREIAETVYATEFNNNASDY